MAVISFRPETENLDFMNTVDGISKSDFINSAIKMYRMYLLRKELREGFSLQAEDDLELCNLDFDEYSSIIETDI